MSSTSSTKWNVLADAQFAFTIVEIASQFGIDYQGVLNTEMEFYDGGV